MIDKIDEEIKLATEQLNTLSKTAVDSHSSWWSPDMTLIVGVIELAFCLIALLIFTFYAMKSKEGFTERYFQLGALIFIGGLAVFITLMGYSNEQMTASIGLLGTIAGYLLGKQDRSEGKSKDTQSNI